MPIDAEFKALYDKLVDLYEKLIGVVQVNVVDFPEIRPAYVHATTPLPATIPAGATDVEILIYQGSGYCFFVYFGCDYDNMTFKVLLDGNDLTDGGVSPYEIYHDLGIREGEMMGGLGTIKHDDVNMSYRNLISFGGAKFVNSIRILASNPDTVDHNVDYLRAVISPVV